MYDIMLLATSILTVAVLLSRLRTLENERLRLVRALSRTRKAEADDGHALAAVGALADELRDLVVSPLTVILGQCELARGQARMQTIEKQARRIQEVVERFRCVGHEHRPVVEEIDPMELCREVIDSLQGIAEERDIGVHEVIEACPRIRSNPTLLRHALRHLLRTAIKAPPAGAGDVTFGVGILPDEHGASYVAFAVADDGPGIPPELMPRAFHPFPDADSPVRGEGYSYAVVYAMARAMGATVVLDSAPGAGTRATLKIPLNQPTSATKARRDALAAPATS